MVQLLFGSVLKVLRVQPGLRKQITHKSCCAMITQSFGFQIVPYLLPDRLSFQCHITAPFRSPLLRKDHSHIP